MWHALTTRTRELRDTMTRFFMPIEVGVRRIADAEGVHTSSTYPDESSMAAMARFPWVRAAFRAKALDLSGVPIVAIQTDPKTGRRDRIPEHPIARSLNRPGVRRGGIQMRRQWYTDHGLTGNGYLIRKGNVLLRAHPARMKVDADPDYGIISRYVFRRSDGSDDVYEPDQVVHVADVSWEDGPNSALGTGGIMALHEDLGTNLAVRKMTEKAAKRGRLEMILSPKGDSPAWGDDLARKISDAFERNRREGSGAFVLGREMDATPLGLSPREMEFSEHELRVISSILAVTGVPPVRVGLPGANYGTTKQQMRTYWEMLKNEAAAFDEALSMLIDDEYITLEHDFSDVEALQVSRSERMAQARSIWEMGATSKEALAFVGFDDAPVPDGLLFAQTDQGVFRKPEAEPDEGQERTYLGWLADARGRFESDAVDPDREAFALGLLIGEDKARQVVDELAEIALQRRMQGRDLSDSRAFTTSAIYDAHVRT